MRIILNNFFSLSAQNAEGVVVWALLFIYGGLLLTTLLDLMTQKRCLKFKWAWSLLVTLVPFLGMAVYAVFSLCIAEYPVLNLIGFGKSNKKMTKKAQKTLST